MVLVSALCAAAARVERAAFLCSSLCAASPRAFSRAGLCGHCGRRIREERHLFLRQWPYLLVCLIILAYGGMMVFRNLAYYDPTLYGQKPHLTSALRFIFTVYAVGHCLRALTYGKACIGKPLLINGKPSDTVLSPPKSVGECFYRLVSFNGNCGDLIFSGHMLLMWIGTLVVARYAHTSWSLPGGQFGFWHNVVVGAAIIISIAQMIMILSARHHYTVDCV
eukprot:gene51250-64938_t